MKNIQIDTDYTEFQEKDGVVLTVAETVEKKDEFRVYLSYQEAKELAKQLVSFVDENNA